MPLLQKLSVLAVRQVIGGACTAVGMRGTEAVASFLGSHFSDHSRKIGKALQEATERAWKCLELALAGDSFWQRCKSVLVGAEDRAFRDQVRTFLDAAPLPDADPAFRQKCLEELLDARAKNLLGGPDPDPQSLAKNTAMFARFGDPESLLKADAQVVRAMAEELTSNGYTNLSRLIAAAPPGGEPLLVMAARYFFRRAVETDAELFQGLAWAKLESLQSGQEKGFAAIEGALASHAGKLEQLLGDVRGIVTQTHGAVLDLKGQIEGQGDALRKIGQAVQQLLEQRQMQSRPVRAGGSLSLRNEGERELVHKLVKSYRALPEEQRRQTPALLNAIGKLEVVAGEFDAAQKDFQAVAALTQDKTAQAEAHFNAYQAALEQRNWTAALSELALAVRLDPKRYAPFPIGDYQPVRILGAGGFGVAFLCKHKHLDAHDVIKTLTLDDLGREAEKVFAEAQVLRQLDHPAVIRVSTCGFADPAAKARPYLVMDYFEGGTLEEHVSKNGPMSVEDLLPVARAVAEGLQAAHAKNILHRDVKPGNLLVRREAEGWRVKVIDFGLAMKQKVLQTSMQSDTSRREKTLVGGSVAGTLDFAPPEQMGKRADPVGPYSDVYGFAKTCCYGLFKTTQPLMKHWKSVPEPLAELLESCLDEDPKNRPPDFGAVLEALSKIEHKSAHVADEVEALTLDDATPRAKPSKYRGARKEKQGSRSFFIWGGAFALVALAIIVVVIATSGGGSKDTPIEVVKGPDKVQSTTPPKDTKQTPDTGKQNPPTKEPPPTKKGTGTQPTPNPKKNPMPTPPVERPVAGTWVPLVTDRATFKQNWKQGDPRGSLFYNPETNGIEVKGPYEMGTAVYDGPWKAFEVQADIKKLSFNQLQVSVNKTASVKADELVKNFVGKGPVTITVEFDGPNETLTVKIGGQVAGRATASAPNFGSQLQCLFSSGGGQDYDAVFTNLRVLTGP